MVPSFIIPSACSALCFILFNFNVMKLMSKLNSRNKEHTVSRDFSSIFTYILLMHLYAWTNHCKKSILM